MESETAGDRGDADLAWALRRRRKPRVIIEPVIPGLRFAFYGRMSTHRQDRRTSRGWQRYSADALIEGRGRIVEEYFDVNVSRLVDWPLRPEAARLLADLVDPGRGFDAIVVGEYARAFSRRQIREVEPYLRQAGVELWLAELEGPVDFDDIEHRRILDELGRHSARESQQARYRTLTAMAQIIRDEGRYMGGRVPYGYQLVDAGLHPDREDARWGRRLQRLGPDPNTARHVQWIFDRRLSGASTRQITEELTCRQVPTPSDVDPRSSRRRAYGEWSEQTVVRILRNPRYTGRAVWGQQRTEHEVTLSENRVLSDREVRRRVPASEWTFSERVAHPPLVTMEVFVAVQDVIAAPRRDTEKVGSTPRLYRLVGHMYCEFCERSMESHWSHGKPAYRCKHGVRNRNAPVQERVKQFYVREDEVLRRLAWCNSPDFHGRSQTQIIDALRSLDAVIVYGPTNIVLEYGEDVVTIP
ncbi:hypothetical protein Cs7R123_64090 [Catellatospora sp. TT07R-123]|uniref:recombinase family protein n=1 Tax=Catellatospora sp. TT07R-123 TaxID=2733863 RepID=UPI001B269B42|nr:recombinase family protein [Catellatospora sp. TT07R-123]GHJ49067.1 hypothetical protein Cs7R123_64090 [Catellatospora sp. TT07R-123]